MKGERNWEAEVKPSSGPLRHWSKGGRLPWGNRLGSSKCRAEFVPSKWPVLGTGPTGTQANPCLPSKRQWMKVPQARSHLPQMEEPQKGIHDFTYSFTHSLIHWQNDLFLYLRGIQVNVLRESGRKRERVPAWRRKVLLLVKWTLSTTPPKLMGSRGWELGPAALSSHATCTSIFYLTELVRLTCAKVSNLTLASQVAQWWRTHLLHPRLRRLGFDPWLKKIP